jgi:predicted DNA-binding transcriptional regulator AlpA
MADRLVHIEEFATIIDRTPAAVRYMIHNGKAPRSAKIGGRRMFKESDIHAWIDAQFEAEGGK